MKYLKKINELVNNFDYDDVRDEIENFIIKKHGSFSSFCNGSYYAENGNAHVAQLKKYLKKKE